MQNGRCRMHGGTNPGAPITTGRYSLAHRESLQAKVEAFANGLAPGDLTGELALMRALMQDFLDRYPEGLPLPLTAIESVFSMSETISKTVERIAKILNQTALTQAEVQLLQAKLTELVLKYIDEPNKRLAFVSELQSSFGAGGGAGSTGTGKLVSRR